MTTWTPPLVYSSRLPKATLFATLLFTDEAGRLLLLHAVNEQRVQRLQLPGGNYDDAAESLWDVARRECGEEIALAFTGEPRVLGVEYIAPRPQWPYAHVGVCFDGGTLTDEQLRAIRLDSGEHTRWEVRHLADWRADLPPAEFDRLAALLAARPATGAYTETAVAADESAVTR